MRSGSRILVPVVSLAIGAAIVALPSGCGSSSSREEATTVRGRVSLDGKPLAGATIVFSPDRDRGGSGKPIRGDTGPDGVFELRGRETATIPPGWYRVAIAPAPDAEEASVAAFPPQLRRPDRSTLVREVSAGKDHFFEFAVIPLSGTRD